MSFTKRIFYFSKKITKIWRRKSIQNSLLLTLSFFFCVGFILNAYAYEPVEIYEEVDEMSSASTTVQGKHSHKSQGFQIVDTTTNLLDLTYPQANANYETHILNNPNLSPGAKLGLVGSAGAAVNAVLYNPPNVDVVEHLAMEWVPNYSDNTGTVYASGYERLQDSGITSLWQMTRNIAYVLFVMVFIVAGFMIMFRHKLGGQTLVTIYNTLPGIIIGLVLVTFSFAIVGIMLDIASFLVGVIANFLEIETTLGHDSVDPQQPLGVWATYSDQMAQVLTRSGNLSDFSNDILGFLSFAANWLLSKVLGSIATLVASIIIAYASIKIFITLIKAYVAVLFGLVLGPLVLAVGTIPGRQGLIKDWFNTIAKNVSVFVVIFLLVNLPIHLFQHDYHFQVFDVDYEVALVSNMIMAAIGIYILFLAGNAPKLLDPLFPQTGGKGGLGAAEGAGRDLSKVPGVGGFFKQ